MISDKGWRIFMILMIVFAVLVFFNFPIGFSGKDYTSTIFSLSGSYYIRTFYDRPVDPEIDGVKYFYNQNGVNYTRSGKRIYIFGILVRDTTTVDPPLPESFKHDDELRDLISYVKTELKDSEFTKKPAIYSIYIYETEKSYSAEFNITGITTLEESNEAFLVFRRYRIEVLRNDASLVVALAEIYARRYGRAEPEAALVRILYPSARRRQRRECERRARHMPCDVIHGSPSCNLHMCVLYQNPAPGAQPGGAKVIFAAPTPHLGNMV